MMYPDAIRSEDGKIYCRYFQPVPKLVSIRGKQMVCTVRHAVSMLLLDEEDVTAALEYLGGCCGKRQRVFSLPNQETVNVFLTGDR